MPTPITAPKPPCQLVVSPRVGKIVVMKTLHATVVKGRLVLDEPSDLPEGTVIEIVPTDEDDLDEQERAALHAAAGSPATGLSWR